MMVFVYLMAILLFFYAISMISLRFLWKKIPHFETTQNDFKTKICVVIPARNEEKNIGILLKEIISQNYPKQLLQIIVMDDDSTDETKKIVSTFPDVKYYFLPDLIEKESTQAYKKKAIELAINFTDAELIVTTDADCNFCENWLPSLAAYYEKNKWQAIIAPVTFHEPKNWFDVFQRIDFNMMQAITAVLGFYHKGALANGANFAYTKNAFEQVNGFLGINHLASGDDMLLLNKINKTFAGKSSFLKSRHAIAFTEAMPSIKDFYKQRIRWASKSAYFKDASVILILGLMFFFNLGLFVLLLAGFFSLKLFIIFLVMIVVKSLAEIVLLYPVSDFYGSKKDLKYILILQPLHIFYIISAGFLSQFLSYDWKGRQTK
ncbi:MAG: glycosyltransferase [Chitinophagaceae bacterium]|nr:glycosyltransferase [Chitinophagaceae bacterium]